MLLSLCPLSHMADKNKDICGTKGYSPSPGCNRTVNREAHALAEILRVEFVNLAPFPSTSLADQQVNIISSSTQTCQIQKKARWPRR